MFTQLRPLLRIAKALEEISRSLTYFAMTDARRTNQIYMTRPSKWQGKDESELMHTDDQAIRKAQSEEFATFLQQGYPGLSAGEELDE